jgi:hypothetical protein
VDTPIRLRSHRDVLRLFEQSAALIRDGSADDRARGRALGEIAKSASITLAQRVDPVIERIALAQRALLAENESLREALDSAKVSGDGLMPLALPPAKTHYPIPPPDVFDAMTVRHNTETGPDSDVIDVDCAVDAVASYNADDMEPEFTEEQLEQLREEQAAEEKRRRGGRPRKSPLLDIREIRETAEQREARLKKHRENSLFHKALKAQENEEIRRERLAQGLPEYPTCAVCRKRMKLDGSRCAYCSSRRA